MSRRPVTRGREEACTFSAPVDAVVVGPGSGGAAGAPELARDGRSVLVLEEGAAMPVTHVLRTVAAMLAQGSAVDLGACARRAA